MYPYLPVGPLTVPTAPFLTIIAVLLGLEAAGRYARGLGVHPDAVWNVALIGGISGLIVARLWNVVQFWYVYQLDPLLIFSVRPSGFALWPGLITALVGGYGYLLYRALDPVRVAAALASGALLFGAVVNISHVLSGAVVGTLSTLPWAVYHFGATVHPVGVYRALGLLLAWIGVWLAGEPQRPARTVWLALLGYSLSRLVADAFVADADLLGTLRVSQLLALAGALLASLLLARTSSQPEPPTPVPIKEGSNPTTGPSPSEGVQRKNTEVSPDAS